MESYDVDLLRFESQTYVNKSDATSFLSPNVFVMKRSKIKYCDIMWKKSRNNISSEKHEATFSFIMNICVKFNSMGKMESIFYYTTSNFTSKYHVKHVNINWR